MIYKCKNCSFLFESRKEPERCPDCGKLVLAKASPEDRRQYASYRKEFGYDVNKVTSKNLCRTIAPHLHTVFLCKKP